MRKFFSQKFLETTPTLPWPTNHTPPVWDLLWVALRANKCLCSFLQNYSAFCPCLPSDLSSPQSSSMCPLLWDGGTTDPGDFGEGDAGKWWKLNDNTTHRDDTETKSISSHLSFLTLGPTLPHSSVSLEQTCPRRGVFIQAGLASLPSLLATENSLCHSPPTRVKGPQFLRKSSLLANQTACSSGNNNNNKKNK